MEDQKVSRREFLKVGAATAAVATTAGPLTVRGEEPQEKNRPLPRRRLGRSNVEVTILNQGTAFDIGERHLNLLHEEGVRCLDLADCYENGKSERTVGEWLNQNGRRKEYVLVTKDHPFTPDQWVEMLDRRLKNAKQDYIDLYFIHALGDDEYPLEASVDWPKDPEWAKAADRIKKSGKARLVGFSSHCNPIERRTALLNNAAQGGWMDAIMLAVNPSLVRENAEFNKALDACHKAGVGLISMKESRGGLPGIKEVFPEFETRGLTPVGAILTAMWTDERFTTICSHMDNITKLKENAATARDFKPMTTAELDAVQRMLAVHPRGYCVGCDGSCRRAAGTQTAFSDIARHLCYYEENGDRARARRLFAALPPEARDWSQADLAAASKACVSKLDFERILARAAEKLA
ncbi:MAG: aldo/keto reductase [Planctomycetota bacterium]